jgi:hypothetical protein
VQLLKNSQHFVEPESSLPCSQESFIGPYPEPDPAHTIPCYLSKIRFNIVNILVLLVVSCGFPGILEAFLFSSFALHTMPISSSLT